jgi:hypothetical protein
MCTILFSGRHFSLLRSARTSVKKRERVGARCHQLHCADDTQVGDCFDEPSRRPERLLYLLAYHTPYDTQRAARSSTCSQSPTRLTRLEVQQQLHLTRNKAKPHSAAETSANSDLNTKAKSQSLSWEVPQYMARHVLERCLAAPCHANAAPAQLSAADVAGPAQATASLGPGHCLTANLRKRKDARPRGGSYGLTVHKKRGVLIIHSSKHAPTKWQAVCLW